ncbi:hypothetical protein B484DRAFT_301185, partial [Ochromonadaceae sp. CCMP2298]
QSQMQRAAELLEVFADGVDKVCLVINSALGSGMGWEDIELMVEAERAGGNPIASLVHTLDLENNKLTLRLKDP